MELRRAAFGKPELEQYSQLFASCFPRASHLTVPYLRWLYCDNPAGKIVGFNAYSNSRLAAHYACLPATVCIAGIEKRALLSLNTATHPDFQGQGLFTRLAESTYASAADEGFDLVFGVANGNSTPGFIRKLGFQLVAPLESRVGIGRLGTVDWDRAISQADFCRPWPEPELEWRLANPNNPIRRFDLGDGVIGFGASAGRLAMQAWAELRRDESPNATTIRGLIPRPRVFLGAFPQATCRFNFVSLPARLRPSPLNFIARGVTQPIELDPRNLSVSFLDFDAF